MKKLLLPLCAFLLLASCAAPLPALPALPEETVTFPRWELTDVDVAALTPLAAPEKRWTVEFRQVDLADPANQPYIRRLDKVLREGNSSTPWQATDDWVIKDDPATHPWDERYESAMSTLPYNYGLWLESKQSLLWMQSDVDEDSVMREGGRVTLWLADSRKLAAGETGAACEIAGWLHEGYHYGTPFSISDDGEYVFVGAQSIAVYHIDSGDAVAAFRYPDDTGCNRIRIDENTEFIYKYAWQCGLDDSPPELEKLYVLRIEK